MGIIGVERFEFGFTGAETENSMENLDIGQSNGYDVKFQDSYGFQIIYDIDFDVCIGQTSKIYVFIVCVGNDMVFIEG